MKKILFILILSCVAFISNAQVQWYRTTAYAFATVNERTGVYNWGNWQNSNMKISINLRNDMIGIYSPTPQRYSIIDTYNNNQPYTDGSGGQTIKFSAIDQDGDRCEIRLRIESNGNSQLYIDFSNCAWVYNVVRIE